MERDYAILGAHLCPWRAVRRSRRRQRGSRAGGGEERIRRQHKAGKKTARERSISCSTGLLTEIAMFVVHQSHDFGMDEQRFPGDGIVTGLGTHPRPPGVRLRSGFHGLRGSLSRPTPANLAKIMDLAMKTGTPVWASTIRRRANPGGRRPLAGYADISCGTALASRRRAPDLRSSSVRGGAVYSRPSTASLHGPKHLVMF